MFTLHLKRFILVNHQFSVSSNIHYHVLTIYKFVSSQTTFIESLGQVLLQLDETYIILKKKKIAEN